MRQPGWAVVMAGLLGAQAAAAPAPADARAERVVIVLRSAAGLAVRQNGTALVVDVPQMVGLAHGVPLPAGRWVRGVQAGRGSVRLSLAPGARPLLHLLADRVVIDVGGPELAMQAGQFRPAVLAEPRAVAPVSQQAPQPPPVRAAVAPASAPAAVSPAAAAPLLAAPPAAPISAAVSLVQDDASPGAPAILLPAGKMTGAAAFSRGGELRVVLDSPVLLDLGQLKDDPVFGTASERLLPDGCELRLKPPVGAVPRLLHQAAGWQLVLGSTAAPTALLAGYAHGGILSVAASGPGRVVAVEDEATGGRLLVGTQLQAGQRVPAGHRAAEWALLPSWQGVVVQPFADRVDLAGTPAGFELRAASPPALAMAAQEGAGALRADGSAMTRRFDFPAVKPPALLRRLGEALRDAATTPPAARSAPRLRVAEAMLASGLDAEASAVLQVAASDNPVLARLPDWQGLSAIAAWLSARAGGGQAPRPADMSGLGGSDEAVLWRSLWDGTEAAAAALAPRWRLVLGYPQALRARVLPAVAELLGQGGQQAALAELLATPDGAGLDLARAGQLQRQGKAEDSLRILDRVAQGSDRLARAQALELAVEQRLAARKLSAGQAAAQLDGQLYAWRGGGHELRLRLRSAALHAQAGEWRAALALLRETDQVFAEAHGPVHDAEVAVVSGLLTGGKVAQLGALDLMALADAASTLLGAHDADARLAPLLADRLLALDLPDRAEPILRRLLDRAGDGAARPGLGLRLASLLAERGDGPGALHVLESSAGAQVDAGTDEQRGLLRARLLAAAGRTREALEGLAALKDTPSVELQAGIREGLQDWRGAEGALQDVMASTAFSALPVAERRAVALRAARDASQAGDAAGLLVLRGSAGLFAGSPDSGLFSVLTADPVQRVADLPRAGRELGEIRALPAALTIAAHP